VNLGVIAVTLAVVAVAELPDKTMIATIVLASRHRPLPVWSGAAAAMVVNAALAVGAGRLLQLLPHRAVDAVVAGLFAAGALYLLAGHESAATQVGEQKAGRITGARHVALASFAVIVVAELGDLTQILTANLAAHYHEPWSVFLGAAVALVGVMGIGVVVGRNLIRVLPLALIRKGAGTLLAGLTVYTAIQTARA
jgi:Ca2+/H+ antiporter, TMEM165/GDT1 family